MTELRKLLDEMEEIDSRVQTTLFEGGLNRVLSQIDTGTMFAVLTAFRDEFSKKENLQRNKALRNKLRSLGMGVHAMVGHWQEAPKGVDYQDAVDQGVELTDATEQAFFVSKSPELTDGEFTKLINQLISTYEQDAAVLGAKGGIYLIFQGGGSEMIGKGYTVDKIDQAYSQMKPNGVPFVFEGVEVPSSNFGKQAFAKQGLSYPRLSQADLKECHTRLW